MIRRADVIATGDPKPAMPSSRAPKQKPMITRTIRRSSGRRRSTQVLSAAKRPESTAMLNSRRALITIHMIGHRAKAAPAAALSSAVIPGIFQTVTASTSPSTRPATEASQAARRTTPISTRTSAIGAAATTKESGRLWPTGVNSWANTALPLPEKALSMTLFRTPVRADGE